MTVTPEVLQVAHPVVQAAQGEVVPAAHAEQAPLLRKKLALQVWQVWTVPEVVQVAQPVAHAEQVAVPPVDVVPKAPAVPEPHAKADVGSVRCV